jgi:hypothetical protein
MNLNYLKAININKEITKLVTPSLNKESNNSEIKDQNQNTISSEELRTLLLKNYRQKHIDGAEPKWEKEYFSDANKLFLNVYKSCNFNIGILNSFSIDYNESGGRFEVGKWFDFVFKRKEYLDLTPTLFRNAECKKNIEFAKQFVTYTQPNKLNYVWEYDLGNWQTNESRKRFVAKQKKEIEDKKLQQRLEQKQEEEKLGLIGCGPVCVFVESIQFNRHIGNCYEYRTPTNNPNVKNLESRCDNNYDTAHIYADIIIRNNTKNPIKDLKLTCKSIASSGTVLGAHSYVLYQVINPKQKVSINVKFPKIDQTKTLQCSN